VRRRWLVAAACVVLAAAAAGIGWVYTHPPLRSLGYTTRRSEDGKVMVYGVDLDNSGRWPLTLTAVTKDGQEVLPPEAIAVANFADGHLAGNAAVNMEANGYKLTTGPVYGWKMLPARRSGLSAYGIRLFNAGSGTFVIHYRYLGLPLRYEITVG